MDLYRDFPVLIIDNDLIGSSAGARVTRGIVDALEHAHLTVLEAPSASDAEVHLRSLATIGCVLLDWDLDCGGNAEYPSAAAIVRKVAERNAEVPLFLLTDRLSVGDLPLDVMKSIDGYIWAMEDTPDFIAGRILTALRRYIDNLMPPFLKALYQYVQSYRYSWHTPGHMGGVAFLKSPVGKVFHGFFGENIFRSDISASVPDLGSLLEHSGVSGESEKMAAQTFGADRTYYVTNGTSTANKMVFHGCVTRGDVVLVDRNCHKSVMQAIIMTGAIPIYLKSTRNAYGTIGPVPLSEFSAESIREKIKRSPFIPADTKPQIKLAVLTNSTYDGLCYSTVMIRKLLARVCRNIMFDEAWYAYARFHDIYKGRYGMYNEKENRKGPTVFACQSSHKVLAALSQGSMLHVSEGEVPFNADRFNEAYMMHSSTSPLYPLIASLDVAARMMQGGIGRMLVQEAVEEAVIFRLKMEHIGRQIREGTDKGGTWWFKVWEPENAQLKSSRASQGPRTIDFDQMTEGLLVKSANHWMLSSDQTWHGFEDIGDGFVMLDPLKVTIQSPGISADGSMDGFGIPACVVARFLRGRGIVVEKSGFYSFLVLFTLGITKGKSGTMLAELFDFRKALDEDYSLSQVFPELPERYPELYFDRSLRDLIGEMHDFLREKSISTTLMQISSSLPEQKMLPDEAYGRLVAGQVEEVPIGKLGGRTSAVMVVPYPPGIPLVMPGEVFGSGPGSVVEFLKIVQEFHNRFPGFEGEVHGARIRKMEDNTFVYFVDCVTEAKS
jgi:arginine decarboxylase